MKEYSIEAVNAEVKKEFEKQKVPNILICGQTGTGKSSALNFLFNDDVAKTGAARPISRGIELYKNDTVNIYDSEGYEIGDDRQKYYEELIFDFLDKHKDVRDAEAVHLVWYTVNGAGTKITDLDIKLVRRIKEAGFNVCVLITKIDEMDEDQLNELRSAIENEIIGIDIFRLSIFSRNIPKLAKYCDWEKLIEWSDEHFPDVLKDRFLYGLRGGLELKHKRAGFAIKTAAALAAGVGLAPIPFSDAALLVPIQTTMILRILALYGIKVSDGSIFSFVGGNALSAAGKAVAGNLIKAIPGVGTLIGGAINAAVASSFTAALGTTLSELCYKQCKDMLDGKPITIDIEKILSSPAFIAEVMKAYKARKKGE